MKFPKKKYNSNVKYYSDYVSKFNQILNKDHFVKLDKITQFIEKKIKQNKQIFICGNGGSASISNHFLCDFNKGIKISSKNLIKPKIISLVNSMELITAISNDISFNKIFDFQLESLAKQNDILIVLSCSGKSKNIINAVKYASKKKIDIISFVGFDKNSLIKKYSKFYINLEIENYGLSEDMFQIIMHMISQFIRQKNMLPKNKREIL